MFWVTPRSTKIPDPQSAPICAICDSLFPEGGSLAARWQPLDYEKRSLLEHSWARLLLVLLLFGAIAGGVYLAFQFRLAPSPAVVSSIERGSLQVRLGESGLWVIAKEGQVAHPGTRLKSAPDTVATVRFIDGGLMRIESEGEWLLRRSEISRNGQFVRIVVAQEVGRASFVPSPVRSRWDALFRVETPGATVDWAGVGTLTTSPKKVTQLVMWQGQANLRASAERLTVAEGQSAEWSPSKVPALLQK